jgi:Methyltransferase domain
MENRNCGTGAAEQTSTLQHYLNLLAARRDSMTALIDLLPANPVIVETGCVRQEDNWEGDGCSTLIWNALVAERGGRAYSVDTDPTAVALAQRLAPRVEVTCGDSIAFLAQLKIDSIDLLYLDGKASASTISSHQACMLCTSCVRRHIASRRLSRSMTLVQIGEHFFG